MSLKKVIIKYRLLTFFFILPILTFIARYLFPPNHENNFFQFNEQSFFSDSKTFIPKNISSSNKFYLQMKEYNNSRVYLETRKNRIKIYLTISKENVYDNEDENIKVSAILLSDNSTNLNYVNNTLYYSQNFKNGPLLLQFRYKENINNYFRDSIYIKLNNISINSTNYNTFDCHFAFEDFDLMFNLQKERFTYKFYYLLDNLIIQIFLFLFIAINFKFFSEYNLRNISIIFLLIVRSKAIILLLESLINIFTIGIPFFELTKTYFHLMLYGEFIFSFSFLPKILLIILVFLNIFSVVRLIFENTEKYYNICKNIYDMDNNHEIKFTIIFFFKYSIILYNVILFNYKNRLALNIIPLYIGLFSVILKHLFQKEVFFLEYKHQCISFYCYTILLYIFNLLINSTGKFYRLNNCFSIYPFLFAAILLVIIIFILVNNYKFKYIINEDFKKIKKGVNDCCSICLINFEYNKKNNNNIFCKINQNDIIYKTDCNHYYHENCLLIWVEKKNTCPICRKGLGKIKYNCFDLNLYFFKSRIIWIIVLLILPLINRILKD